MTGVDSPIAALNTAAGLPDYRVRIEFWAVLGCALLFLGLIELVRRNRLKERYSFLWFTTLGVLAVFAVRRDWLGSLANLVGVYYPPTALFLILVFFMLLILIHFSTVISRLLNDKQVLTQHMGILESRVRTLERQAAEARGEEASREVRISSSAD
jgi:hypothetical protein